MPPLDVIEPQRVAKGMQYLFGRLPGAALFQTGVVLGTHPGQPRDLTAPQTGNPATGAELDRQTDLIRRESSTAGPQEVAQVVTAHGLSLIFTQPITKGIAGPASTTHQAVRGRETRCRRTAIGAESRVRQRSPQVQN